MEDVSCTSAAGCDGTVAYETGMNNESANLIAEIVWEGERERE